MSTPRAIMWNACLPAIKHVTHRSGFLLNINIANLSPASRRSFDDGSSIYIFSVEVISVSKHVILKKKDKGSVARYFQVQTKSPCGLFFFLEHKGVHRKEIAILVESLSPALTITPALEYRSSLIKAQAVYFNAINAIQYIAHVSINKNSFGNI